MINETREYVISDEDQMTVISCLCGLTHTHTHARGARGQSTESSSHSNRLAWISGNIFHSHNFLCCSFCCPMDCARGLEHLNRFYSIEHCWLCASLEFCSFRIRCSVVPMSFHRTKANPNSIATNKSFFKHALCALHSLSGGEYSHFGSVVNDTQWKKMASL